MKADSVSVVIAAYNAASLLDRCLDSVMRQTVPVQEIWVVNDGSTDETGDILQRWQAEYDSIHVIHQLNQGSSAARNAGIQAANSEWIAFLDHDDTWMPEKIERMLAARNRDREAAVLYHDALRPDSTRYLSDKHPAEGFILDQLLKSYFILPSTTMIRREVLIAARMFNTSLRRAEDYELFLRLSRRWRFLLLNEPLTYYEQQPTSLTRDSLAMTESLIAVFEELIVDVELTAQQRTAVSRRLAGFYYQYSYHVRPHHLRESWRALRRSLHLEATSIATWKLLAANLWHTSRNHRT